MPRVTTVRKHWFPKAYADVAARLRVPAGFVMLAAFGYFAQPTAESMQMGLPVSMSGLALRAWAAGHLRKNQKLATSGPYSFTRNPLYLGTLITAMGLAMSGNSVGLGAFFAAIFVLVYLPAIELEEQHLLEILPDYAEYAARVPLLVPSVPSGTGDDAFSLAQYLKNEEYQALIGWLLAVSWLAARMYLHW
jgi:protein-S-isoprenylcysteine O-methyltransferase Ste14